MRIDQALPMLEHWAKEKWKPFAGQEVGMTSDMLAWSAALQVVEECRRLRAILGSRATPSQASITMELVQTDEQRAKTAAFFRALDPYAGLPAPTVEEIAAIWSNVALGYKDACAEASRHGIRHVGLLLEEVKRLREEHAKLQTVAESSPLRTDLRAIVEDAVGRTAKLYKPLQYTLDPPITEGAYWLRDYLRGRSYLAQYQDGEVWILEPEDGEVPRAEPIAEFGSERWEWAGPIVEPESTR